MGAEGCVVCYCVGDAVAVCAGDAGCWCEGGDEGGEESSCED